MNILDRFTSIDDQLVSLLERIGGVTEEDTHFFSYPNDGTRATITKGTTKLDFMAGTVMTPLGLVASLGNSLRARGREYCRSLSLQADRDIIIQIGTKSKIPVFAGTWFKVAHLRFTDIKIIAAEDTRIFVIACTNPDSIEMAGESYVKDPVDVWGTPTTIGLAELAVRTRAPPMVYDRRGDVLRWVDFESATPNYSISEVGSPVHGRTTETAHNGSFSYKSMVDNADSTYIKVGVNDFHLGRMGNAFAFASEEEDYRVMNNLYYYAGATLYRATLRYERDTSKLLYFGSAGGYIELATVSSYKDISNFSTLKLVADFDKLEYVRASAFGVEYDLSGIALNSVGGAVTRHVEGRCYVAGTAVVPVPVYIDNMIITENEPI